MRLKGKVYETDLGSEESTREEVGCGGNEDVNLRWMSGVTTLDRIRNERIRGTTKVGEIAKKVQESRLKWHVLRREDEYVGRRCRGKEGEEGQSGGGWIASGTTCQRENEDTSTPHKSGKR